VSSFYHFDALGTTRRVTAADESTQLTYVRDAFGSGIASTGTTTNRFRYTGKLGYVQEDTLAGALLRRRYYQYEIGRFVSRDPLRDPGRSEYGYVGNRPTRAVDPTGRQLWPEARPPVTWRPDPPIDVVIEPPLTLRAPAVPSICYGIRYENGFGVPVPIGSMPPGTYFPWPFDPKYELEPWWPLPPARRLKRPWVPPDPLGSHEKWRLCVDDCYRETKRDMGIPDGPALDILPGAGSVVATASGRLAGGATAASWLPTFLFFDILLNCEVRCAGDLYSGRLP
jgi:RHS repeat-associated protein